MSVPLRELEPGLSVCGQLLPDDLPDLVAQGFRSLICNRPDEEEPDQPDASEIEAKARALGLHWTSIPVTSATLGDPDIDAFADALARMPRPILAYCRSGNRCCVLWGLARSKDTALEELESRAREAGYDLTAWRPRMLARAAAD